MSNQPSNDNSSRNNSNNNSNNSNSNNSNNSNRGNRNNNFSNRNKSRRNKNRRYDDKNSNNKKSFPNNNSFDSNYDISEALKPHPEWEIVNCCYCDKPVTNLYTAISVGEHTRAHFECVIKDIESKETLEKDEKITYLGKGSFGIVRSVRNGGSNFFIRKRIQVEDENNTVQWRREVSSTLKKGNKQ
ncbi:MAG: hypothetical protein JXR63_04700 [Spirochaetales bacterium]|nr:hypothetical protein [Spirochaetales bacterium]